MNDRRGTLDDMEKLVRDNQALESFATSNVELNAAKAQIQEWENRFRDAITMEEKSPRATTLEEDIETYGKNLLEEYKMAENMHSRSSLKKNTIKQWSFKSML